VSSDSATMPGPATISLPSILDITAAADLKRELMEALASGGSLNVNAGAVQRVTTPCLQILAAAAKSVAQAGGGRFRLHSVPRGLSETIAMLGLEETFGIGEVER